MNKVLRIISTLLFVSLFVVPFVSPHKAHADVGTLGAHPTYFDPSNPKTASWFIYQLKPGQSKQDSITVVNNSNESIQAQIYAVDATTTNDGAFALLQKSQKQTGVGIWIDLSKNMVTIKPKGHVDVPFTITIPSNITVGDHAGGIIVQQVKQSSTASKGIGLNIVTRVGTRVYETVPGKKVFSLDLQNLRYKIENNHLVFTFTLVNNGNVILTPTGFLDIKDRSGKSIDRMQIYNLGSIFPGKPVTVTTTADKVAPWFGQYSATVDINYTPTKSIARTISFFIFVKDWRVALPIPIIAFLIVLYILFRRRVSHRKRFGFSEQKFQSVQAVATGSRGKIVQAKSVGAKQVFAPVTTENVDAIFISRHIKLLVFLVAASVLVLSGFFAFALQDFVLAKVRSYTNTPVSTPALVQQQVQPTQPPTPTVVPVDKSTMKITVLNGSGVAGAAGKIKDTLTKDGFTVARIGNASEHVTQTEIQYPFGQQAGADLLKQELLSSYSKIVEVATNASTFTITLGQ